ncbi:MAG: aminoglycoside phosphotransferase [Gammaproteobacteria bacterium]|jgi:aminoglycoside phosphotransferase family enzyme/predicted kinase|nr:aminoglycoside phosphotransferase [Gammaproteobacteria bacterium]
MSPALIQALQNPALYDHPVESFRVIETHISWVILTGHFAYKIKKPVNLEFLDFSDLAKRRYYCHQEVRANQALSPEVYLAVLPITGTAENPSFSGEGETIDYAILMREFSQENLLTALLQRRELTTDLIDEIAILLARFHQKASKNVPDDFLGTAEQVYQPVKQNFEQIRELLDASKKDDAVQVDALEKWSYQQWQRLQTQFTKRKAEGFIRECHGDIHLGNITLINNKPVIFDCIEFNDALRWTDTMADIAFLTIDLLDNNCAELSNQLLSYYLEYCGDYEGLSVLPFYQVYRAIVRAKVNLFRYAQAETEAEKIALYGRFLHYMSLAEKLTKPHEKILFLTYGLAGSGKSTVSQTLVRERAVIRLRSDIIRKRIHDLHHLENSGSGVNEKIYSSDATNQTYQYLESYAKTIIENGFSVVADAAFLLRSQRASFIHLANSLGVPLVILACAAPIKTLRARIELRQAMRRDASEATVEVLEMQRQKQEYLTGDELEMAIVVDAEDEDRYNLLNEKVNAFLANTE